MRFKDIDRARVSRMHLSFALAAGRAVVAGAALIGCQLVGGIRDRELEPAGSTEPSTTTMTAETVATTGAGGGTSGAGGSTGGGAGPFADAAEAEVSTGVADADVADVSSDRGANADAPSLDSGRPDATIPTVHVGTTPLSQLSAGLTLSCGVATSTGSVLCWGRTLGAIPTGRFSQVSVGGSFACALQSDGAVVCWGNNGAGQLSPPMGPFKSVTTGDSHGCAQHAADNSVVCWGNNRDGQATSPTSVYFDVSAGGDRTCVLGYDYIVNCWGAGMSGGVKIGNIQNQISQVSAGALRSCALRKDHTSVSCWDNGGTQTVVKMGNFVEIGTGASSGCAIDNAGSISCWGPTLVDEPTPAALAALGPFSHVTSGDGYACALKTADHLAVCWGKDDYGQAEPP